MRAVNLMPDARRPGRDGSSASMPAPVYVLLGGLAMLVVFVSLWTVTNRQIDSDTAKLARIDAEAQTAEKRAQAFASYQEFAELARSRKATITTLSATRFDWAHALREVARVVPDNVWLATLDGSSGASAEAPEPTSSATPAPRLEMQGCTKSQAQVARLMARLRAVDGVRSVELKTSVKPDAAGSGECPADKAGDPAFTIVISFAAPGQPKAAVDSSGQISTSAPSAPAGAGSPAPAPAPAPAAPGGSPAPSSSQGAR